MLIVEDLYAGYGEKVILRDVSLQVGERELVSLIGSNGAGKTTFLKTVSGLVPFVRGKIKLSGIPLTGLPPHRITRLGISQVPEGRQVFGTLSTLDNLLLGAYHLRHASKRKKEGAATDLQFVFALFPRLRERQTQRAGTLSGGEQQMLAMGRALMSQPKLLLLDEPSLGLAPLLVNEILDVIVRLVQERGIAVLLVEQNARAALGIAARAYVLESGRIVLSGAAEGLLENPEVKRAYLGAEIFQA